MLSHEEGIQRKYLCATIRISHKKFFAKNFAAVELNLNEDPSLRIESLQQ